MLDTVTFCELGKRQPHMSVARWLAMTDEDALFVSVITVGEVEKGIAAVSPQDPMRAPPPPVAG